MGNIHTSRNYLNKYLDLQTLIKDWRYYAYPRVEDHVILSCTYIVMHTLDWTFKTELDRWMPIKGGNIVRTPGLSFPDGFHIQLLEKHKWRQTPQDTFLFLKNRIRKAWHSLFDDCHCLFDNWSHQNVPTCQLQSISNSIPFLAISYILFKMEASLRLAGAKAAA